MDILGQSGFALAVNSILRLAPGHFGLMAVFALGCILAFLLKLVVHVSLWFCVYHFFGHLMLSNYFTDRITGSIRSHMLQLGVAMQDSFQFMAGLAVCDEAVDLCTHVDQFSKPVRCNNLQVIQWEELCPTAGFSAVAMGS